MKRQNKSFLQNLELRSQMDFDRNLFKSKCLAIDFGEKFSGLALFERQGFLNLGICDTSQLKQKIREIINIRQVKNLVFGLPLGTDGRENLLCKKIKKFARIFAESCTVHFVDERNSSQDTLLPPQKNRIDDQSALNILEYFLRERS